MKSGWIMGSVMGSALVLGIGLVSAGAGQEHGTPQHGEKEAEETEPICPVTGEPANLAVSVATDEGPVFFCGEDCVAKYQADPGKYSAKVAAQGKALAGRAKVQVTCPVTGKPVDKKVHVEHEGKKVYFCCGECVGKFQESPKKYMAALLNSHTCQTKCPVMGGEIDPAVSTTLASGLKVYFCCKGCDKKFHDHPGKYLANLASQGFRVQPAQVKRSGDD